MHRALPAAALGCIAAATQRRAKNDAADAPPPPVYRRQSLEHVQLGERWPRDTAGMVGIPKRAWPERQPEVEEVPALRELLSSPEFSRDALTLALRAGPPSTSMAQWLALATGSTAALTGVYGDKRLAETGFDSVFRQARLHGLSSFATGSPWFTELFHSQLLRPHRFFAEGAVPPTYGTWAGWPQAPTLEERGGEAGFIAGDEADKQRMLLLHRALSSTQTVAALAADRGPTHAAVLDDDDYHGDDSANSLERRRRGRLERQREAAASGVLGCGCRSPGPSTPLAAASRCRSSRPRRRRSRLFAESSP